MAIRLSGQKVLLILGMAAANLLLVWAGVAAFTASETHDYDFNESLGFGQLFADMIDLSLVDVLADAGSFYFLPFAVPLMLISLGLAVASFVGNKTGLIWFALLITVPYGLIGILGSTTIDGEWAGEGWPVATATTIWMVVLAMVAGATSLIRRDAQLAERVN